jgi:hypothetical protein
MATKRSYPITGNCNFESRDDAIGRAIYAARKAVESGHVNDADLIVSLDNLEDTLSEYAERGDKKAVRACREAESAVSDAWAAAKSVEE